MTPRLAAGLAAAVLVLAALVLSAAAPCAARDAGDRPARSDLARDRPAPAEPARFTDEDILRGFLAVAIGAEFSTAVSDRIRRFDGPVRVRIDASRVASGSTPGRVATVEAVVAEIGRRIAGLDLATTPEIDAANLTVILVPSRGVAGTVREVFGRDRAKIILRRLQPQCVSGFSRDAGFRIDQAAVVLATDVSDFDFRDCAYEEILQALGPINDTAAVPWTMFNDEVRTGRFGRYDRYLLGLLYHPRMRPGMTRGEARATALAVLPEVRAEVDRDATDTGDAPHQR